MHCQHSYCGSEACLSGWGEVVASCSKIEKVEVPFKNKRCPFKRRLAIIFFQNVLFEEKKFRIDYFWGRDGWILDQQGVEIRKATTLFDGIAGLRD